MENYSVWADLLHTFRMMSDGVKVLLIYMPCIFALGFTALYMHHLRRSRDKTEEPATTTYTVLPPQNPRWKDDVHPSIQTLRNLNSYVAQRSSERERTRE